MSICAGVPDAYREHAAELAEQLEFQRGRLEEARAKLDGAPLVLAYDNGGGQTGIRKNPAFEAYNALMGTYIKTLEELRGILGSQAAAQPKMVEFAKFAKTMRRAAND